MLVCDNCFGDRHLKNRIREKRKETGTARCDFHPRKKGVPIEDVSDIVAPVFEGFYDSGKRVLYEDENDRGIKISQEGKILSACIEELCQTTEQEIVKALSKLVQQSKALEIMGRHSEDYDDERKYVRYEKSGNTIALTWESFKKRIKREVRYLDPGATETLKQIFFGFEEFKKAIKHLDSGKELYRCRLATNYRIAESYLTEPFVELSAPPHELSKHNRLSAKGISCFYGAFTEETAVAEVRPAIQSLIVSCQFKLRRPIKVIDLTVFREVKNYEPFDKRYAVRHKLFRFLNEFLKELELPVSPEEADLQYVPSQVVSEYFQHLMETESGKIEGIIFYSSQKKNGKNIALFNDASKCLEAEFHKTKTQYPDYLHDYFCDYDKKICGLSYVPDSAKMITLESIDYKLK